MENFINEYSKILDETGGHLSFQALATYNNLKEKLSSKEKNFIESHLKSCIACNEKYKTVLEEDIELDAILEYNEIIQKETSTAKTINIISYWKYTAAAVIVIGITAVFYFLITSKNEEILTDKITTQDIYKRNDKAQADSSSWLNKPEQEEKIEDESITHRESNETFAANTVLENFINRNVRSEKTIEIISPKIGADVGSSILFKWKRISSIEPLVLTIVDNKNSPIYEMTVEGSKFTLDKKLKTGLYYWKLFSNNNLQTLGKFYVKAP